LFDCQAEAAVVGCSALYERRPAVAERRSAVADRRYSALLRRPFAE